MIYVTGDLHGDLERFRQPALRKLKKGDTLLVCGDFGFLWHGGKKEEQILKWIGKRRYQVLFIEGTHDNLTLLKKYPQEDWNGGKSRLISGNLRHLCRGHIFNLENSSFFVCGGGESKDADSRGEAWWSGELPEPEELEQARCRLEEQNWQVDYIVTHEASRRMKQLLTMEEPDANILDVFFDEVRERCGYRRWFFGALHRNKAIPPREMALFNAVVPVTADSLSARARS